MLKFIAILAIIQYAASLNTSTVLYQEIFAYHNETGFKAEFANQVVEKVYGAFRQWFFTIIFCEFTYFENRILKYTETKDFGYPVLLLNGCPSSDKRKVKPRLARHGQTAYIVTSNELSLEGNEIVLAALKRTGVFKPRSVVIFVINIPVAVDSYFYYQMEEHFELLCSRRITNSVLVVWSDKLRMYTYNPFFKEVREITNVKNVYSLLRKQYHNLYGHVLRLSVFRKIFVSDATGPIHCDSRLATTVMSFMNATCLPLVPRDGNTVGDLLDNGTATGVTGDLIDGYTELELSSRILKNSYYGYIDTTYPLAEDELCFVVKKSDKQSTFMSTIKLISTDILLLFIFNMIFFTTVAVFARKAEVYIKGYKEKQSTSSIVMDLIKCFVRQTVDIKFLGPMFRFVVLLIIVYSLIVDCAIDGIITSAITYPRYKPDLDTTSQLLKETNLKFGVHNRHMKIFYKSLTDDYQKLFEDRVRIFTDKKIKLVIDNRMFQYSVLLRKSDGLFITRKLSNMKNGRPMYHIVKECPVPCKIVYGLQYGSPYLPRIEYILHHLNQAGILQHWSESEEYTLYKNVGKILLSGDNKERKPLNIENLKEVFFMWLCSLLICSIAFFLEVLLYNIRNSKVFPGNTE